MFQPLETPWTQLREIPPQLWRVRRSSSPAQTKSIADSATAFFAHSMPSSSQTRAQSHPRGSAVGCPDSLPESTNFSASNDQWGQEPQLLSSISLFIYMNKDISIGQHPGLMRFSSNNWDCHTHLYRRNHCCWAQSPRSTGRPLRCHLKSMHPVCSF